MGKKSKKRLVESAELGVNARREGVKSPCLASGASIS